MRHGTQDDDIVARIDATPMVGVMLVLLLVPLLVWPRSASLAMELPRSTCTFGGPGPVLTVSVDQDLQLYADRDAVDLLELRRRVRVLTADEDALVRGIIATHRDVSHAHVVPLIALLRQEGVHHLAFFVHDPPGEAVLTAPPWCEPSPRGTRGP